MAASSEAAFDDERLSGELARAVDAEETYQRVNDMKKRAITTAASYDEFKNLVACAQDGLKPVTNRQLQEDLLKTSRSSFSGAASTITASVKAISAEHATRAGMGGRKRLGRRRRAEGAEGAEHAEPAGPAAGASAASS